MADGDGCWSSLPSDILEQVSGGLSTDADHLSAHQVCPHWRASTLLPTAFRPWIVAHGTKWSRSDEDYSLWPLRRAERVETGAAPAGLPYCHGASRGWLVLTDHAESPTRLVLWEPLSNAQIPLPCLNPVTHVFLSGDPLAPSPPSGWMAVANQPHGDTGRYRTLFCRPQDAAWSFLYDRTTAGVGSVALHGGKMYFLEATSHYLYVYDATGGTMAPPTCLGIFPTCVRLNQLCRCDRFHSFRGAYVVTCNGEPLLVVLRLGRGHPSFAEVYRPEWAQDGGGLLPLRDRVTDLGEHSLFLGRGDTFALSAKEFPSIKRNHIYCVAHDRNYTRGQTTLQNWAFVFN